MLESLLESVFTETDEIELKVHKLNLLEFLV
jgi:hypothetical protein